MVYPEDTVLLAGDSVLLTCVGTGVPAPTLTFYKNGGRLIEDNSKYTVTEKTMLVENTLFVKSSILLCNASEVDIGNYSCMADNAIREPASENFLVEVQSKFTSSPIFIN